MTGIKYNRWYVVFLGVERKLMLEAAGEQGEAGA
jgi:hypothetical protein